MKQEYRIKRIIKNIKIKDIAKHVGCSSTTICRWEKEEDFIMIPEKVDMYKHYIDQN